MVTCEVCEPCHGFPTVAEQHHQPAAHPLRGSSSPDLADLVARQCKGQRQLLAINDGSIRVDQAAATRWFTGATGTNYGSR